MDRTNQHARRNLPQAPMFLLLVLLAIGLLSWLGGSGWRGGARTPRWREGRYDSALRAASRRSMPAAWDWRILKAMVRQESGLRPRARSQAGALGLCQVMPATARELGVPVGSLDEPEVAIDTGTRYLRWLWDGWPDLPDGPPHWTRSRFALACYNAGPTRVHAIAAETRADTWQELRPNLPTETQGYVDRIFDVHLPAYAGSGSRPARPARPSFSWRTTW